MYLEKDGMMADLVKLLVLRDEFGERTRHK